VRDYSQSLRLGSLIVRSPSNSFNTLMLNYAGLQTALETRFLTIDSNSVFLTLASALRGVEIFSIDGTVNHGALSEVSATNVSVGTYHGGVYNLSNGVLTVSNLQIGASVPLGAAFNQEGGSNRTDLLQIWNGTYFLNNGDLRLGRATIAGTDALFYQRSGQATATRVTLGLAGTGYLGRYTLADGILSVGQLEVGTQLYDYYRGDGYFEQSGGSNFVGTLRVGDFGSHGPSYGDSGRYDLHGGLLVTSNTMIGVGLSGFYQTGGDHIVNGQLNVHGYYDGPPTASAAFYGHYQLDGGRLFAKSVYVRVGGIQHSIGTNEVSGDLVLEQDQFANGWYSLDGGRVVTSNTLVIGSYEGRFQLSSGVHEVRGLLDLHATLQPAVRYMIQSGDLFVQNIRVSTNSDFRHWGGTVHHTGRLVLEGGTWESAPGDHRLGVLKLNSSSVESTLFFRDPNSTLRFARSASEPWAPDARLVIIHWGGSNEGWPRVFFGTNSAGLTSQQLSQIRFRDPYDPSADRVAHIRATGQVVPVPNNTALISGRTGNRMVLQWPADYGFTLETSTNITGPFSPVIGATAPHTNQIVPGQRRFFRLRR